MNVVPMENDVEIIDTKVIDALPVDADKCKHCLTTGKWQTIIRAKWCHIPTEFLLDSGASLNVHKVLHVINRVKTFFIKYWLITLALTLIAALTHLG